MDDPHKFFKIKYKLNLIMKTQNIFQRLEEDSGNVESALRSNIFSLISLNTLEINLSYGFAKISNNNEY